MLTSAGRGGKGEGGGDSSALFCPFTLYTTSRLVPFFPRLAGHDTDADADADAYLLLYSEHVSQQAKAPDLS